MTATCHFVVFLNFFLFFFIFFNIFLNGYVSIQECVMCHFVVFLNFLFYFFWIFLNFFKCPCANPVVCHVAKSIFYIQFGPYICYFCSIRSQFLLTLTNLVPIEDVTKFNFYIKVIMMWILIYYIKIFNKKCEF